MDSRTPPASQSDEALVVEIASILDHPSLYMGGPSWGSKIKAERILPILKRELAKAKANVEMLAEGLAHIAEYGRTNPGYGYSCGTRAASVLATYREKNNG